jgi:uncharacterized protein (DUF2252 family)
MDRHGVPSSSTEVQEFFLSPRPNREQRRAEGAARRSRVPLASLAEVPTDRADPVALLARQEAHRIASLIDLRHERMVADPFAFLRGAALIMADDLSRTSDSGITVQLCGDAHVANFGMFASAERDLLFDLNDFDETLPGPFEWDVKRLAASLVVAAEANGHTRKQIRKSTRAAVASYRTTMARLAAMRTLDVWYASLDVRELLRAVSATSLGDAAAKAGKKAARRTGDSAVAKLTEVVDGVRRFRPDPPIVVTIPPADRPRVHHELAEIYARYLRSMPADRIALLMRYSFADIAHKVVGVGSVGTVAMVVLMETGDGEPLILQVKQATTSVLEPYLGSSRFAEAGRRVVVGQRVMQAAGDPFLGWTNSGGEAPVEFYVRQLRDMKGAIETTGLNPEALRLYGRTCAAVLARAHARGGNAAQITGYLGEDEAFEHAVTEFAVGYSSVNAHDHAALRAAMA